MKFLRKTLIAGVMLFSAITPANAVISNAEYVVTAAGDQPSTQQEGTVQTRVPKPNVNLGTNDALVSAVVDEIYNATDVSLINYDTSTGIMEFDIVQYNSLNLNDRKDYMKVALPYIKESSLSPMVKNKLFNFIKNQDTETTQVIAELDGSSRSNIYEAGRILRPFDGAISTFFGIITILIFVFMSLSAVLDLVYISIPFFTSMSKNRFARGDNYGGGRPFFVSREAYEAVEAEEANPQENTAVWLYFKKRFVIMFVMGLIMLYFMNGEIIYFIIFVIEAFRPLWEQLKF